MKRLPLVRPRHRTLGALAVLTAACGLLLAAAHADPPAAAGKGGPPAVLHILPLKYARASDLQQTVTGLAGTEGMKGIKRMVVDPRTNSLLIVGTPEGFAALRRYVVALDVPGGDQDGAESVFRVFPLGPVVPDEDLQRGLNAAIGKGDGRFVVDSGRRLLIVSGPERTVRTAEELLRRIEAAQPQPARRALRVRMLWLATALRGRKQAVPPRDVRDAVEELARLGIEDLALVSQSVVDVAAGKEFRSQGVAALDTPCSVSIHGTALERPGEDVRLELSIDVVHVGGRQQARLCQLSTAIACPLGHYVMLGVTPTEATTSVFVVQVTPAGGKATPRRER
jgi:hypothetical protein